MIGPYHYAVLGTILFFTGLGGIVIRRNIISILISIEVAINGIFLLFFAGSLKIGYISQAIVLILMAVAAVEAAVGIALAIAIFRTTKSARIEGLSELKN